MKYKPTVVNSYYENTGVFGYVPAWQYRRYYDLLNQEKVSAYSSDIGFTNEQLRVAARAMGKCPPGYQNRCKTLSLDYGSDTPFISPMPGITPFAQLNNSKVKIKDKTFNVNSKHETKYTGTKYISTFGNSSGAGTPEGAVWRNMPGAFGQQKYPDVVSPEKFGYGSQENNGITSSKFISATHQRISGGSIVENSRKLSVVPRTPKTLNYIVLEEGDQSKTLKNLTGLNETTKFFSQGPKVGTTVTLNGQTFQNVQVPGGSGFDGVPPVNGAGGAGTTGDDTGGGTGGGDGSDGGGGTGGGNGGGLSDSNNFDLLDINGVRFNQKPAIDITPLEIDSQGNYFAGGPTARAVLGSPTPEVSFPANNLMGIPENTELLINGRKVIIRGNDLTDIKTQINCGNMGVTAVIEEGDSAEQQEISLISCDGGSFTVANGCGGGTYQQVGDFHINRGFEQQRNKTVNSNTHLISASLSTTVDKDTGVINRKRFAFYDSKGNLKDLDADDSKENYLKYFPVPAFSDNENIISNQARPFFLDTESDTSTFTTAGSGYSVGDRLRLVGGTPVTNSKGPITKICIENAGSGYKNPANLQVLIDSTDSSGIGAVAVVTSLDENGGIAEIVMRNGGTGYDFKEPPKITVYDSTPSTTEYTEIDAAWPAEPYGASIGISAKEYVRINAQMEIIDATGKVVGNEVQSRYLMAVNSHTFGGSGNYVEIAKTEAKTNTNNVTNVELITDQKYKNRAKISLANTSNLIDADIKGMRPNSYVQILHHPASAITGPLEILSSQNSGASNFEYTVEYNAQLKKTYDTQNERSTSPDLTIQASRQHVALYANVSGTVECVAHSYAYDPDDNGNITLSSIYDTTGTQITAEDVSNLSVGGEVYISPSTISRFWIPEHYSDGSVLGGTSTSSPYFVITHPEFDDESTLTQMFPENTDIRVYNVKPWWNGIKNVDNPPFIDSIDPRTPKNTPELSAKIGLDPTSGELLDEGEGGRNYKTFAGPLRVAKFIVTGVDSEGAITSLRVIDRGLYKSFPSDLTYGIPLEYDYATDGSVSIPEGKQGSPESDSSLRGRTLGVVDPARNNIPYGTELHPEYTRYSNFKSGRGIFISENDQLIDGFGDPDEWKKNKDFIVQVVEDSNETPEQRIWYNRWVAAGKPTTQSGMWFFSDQTLLAQILQKHNRGDSLTASEQEIFDSYQTSKNILIGRSGLQKFKHPEWAGYQEFYYDGTNFQPYTGSPGAYDPSTYVALDADELKRLGGGSLGAKRLFNQGKLLRKDRLIELDPQSLEYGLYKGTRTTGELELAGGSGARVFLTAQDVPNCTEKGTAKESLNLPDEVVEVNLPKAFARALNNALTGAGYSPTDIKFAVSDLGEIGQIDLSTDFPGVRIEEPNPGFLDKLGLPTGDYNVGMLCIEATLNDPTLTNDQANAIIDQFYDSEYFGVLSGDNLANVTGQPAGSLDNTAVMSLLCVDRVGTNGNPPYYLNPDASGVPYFGTAPVVPLNDNNSVFNGGFRTVISELYRYDVTNIYGEPVRMGSTDPKQVTDVSVFSSKRFNQNNQIELVNNTPDAENTGPDLFGQANAWVDNYNGGWAYLENGVIKRNQEALTDTKFITNAIAYDRDTGIKNADLNLWDPFKGVIPAIIKNEIHHISEADPVAYSNTRSSFGRAKVGQVWWDTSTVRYEWYEQGSDTERNKNWGRTFPGSSITVCEWVESKSLPTNWNGNGIPRWRDRYVTERHHDSETGNYEQYYYYWIQNRTVLDDRVKRNWGRQFDTETIARYISNPVKNGLNILSFVSPSSFSLHNTNQYIEDNDTHIQINYSSNLNPEGLKHTAWKLMREGDDRSDVPEHISDKLIDSLASEDAVGNTVPDPTLSYAEKYGINFRPRQTMFANVKHARRVMASTLNEMLADIKLNTQYPEWDSDVQSFGYIWNTVNWYEKIRTTSENKVIRYDDSYKPVYKISSVAELYKFKNLPDGTVIQVSNVQNNTTELWIYVARDEEYKQISIEQETIQFNDAVFTDNNSPLLSTELRSILIALRDKVFLNTNNWNKFFFTMLKHAYMEQNQLDWAFKTSYLYVEKEEDDLVTTTGFKPDNFQKVLDYMNEVKPYTAKIREYKDGKKTPIEYIGTGSLSDFDNPPYVDQSIRDVRILDENNPADYEIMENSIAHRDYTATMDKSQSPIRTANTTLVFDRTNWQPTMRSWDKTTTPINMSIAQNFANIVPLYTSNITLQADAQGYLSVSNNIRAVDRILAYSPDAKATFIAEINTYFDDVTAFNNADIVANSTALYNVIEDGGLDRTLALLKETVGGNFRGEALDGKKFQTIIDDVNYINEIIKEFGFDTQGFDQMIEINDTVFTDDRNEANYGIVTSIGVADSMWDSTKELVNYEGVFDTETQGNVTLRRNDENYEGFDGVTFQRVLYGEERPEEMALIDPLESVVMTVTTSEFALGQEVITTQYDAADVANANVIHSGISLSNIEIVNAGVGYINPDLIIFDSPGYSPTTDASANVVVDANGSVTGFTDIVSGSGYNTIGFRLEENINITVFGDVKETDDTITVLSSASARVGQLLTFNNNALGEIVSIVGTTLHLSQPVGVNIGTGNTVNATGKDFYARPVLQTTTETVRVDRQYATQEWINVSVSFSSIPGNTSEYEVSNVVFTHFNNGNITNIVSGTDPDETSAVYFVDTETGWDSANADGAQGSFDVPVEGATAQVVDRIPFGAEVKYRIHQNLFGTTDYLRIRSDSTSECVGNVYSYTEQITLLDGDEILIDATTRDPGVIWLGSEKILYARRSGNTVSLLTRGASGTTIQDHVSGTPVYGAEDKDLFNHLNPAANIWLDTGTRYTQPEGWDEINAGLNGILESTLGNEVVPTGDDVLRAWDQLANGNITVSTVSATVDTLTATESNITLSSNMTLTIGEAVRITDPSNVANTEVVSVTAVSGTSVSLEASYNDTLDTNIFVVSGTVNVSSFDYGTQTGEDTWDSATIAGQTATSLADRANADYTTLNSIMRFLHNL